MLEMESLQSECKDLMLAETTYFLRVIATLAQHSDMVSDIPSGSIYGVYILTFFLAYDAHALTFYLASILTYFLASMLTFFLASIQASFRHCLASILTFYLTFSSGMCSGPGVPHNNEAGDMAASAASEAEEGRRRTRREGRGRGGRRVAPLLKSRDPHLAGGGICFFNLGGQWVNCQGKPWLSLNDQCPSCASLGKGWCNLIDTSDSKHSNWP